MWLPGTEAGSTMTVQFIVLSALTTRHSGKTRWICSPSESVLQTDSVGGMPCEKSSGFATSHDDLALEVHAARRLERLERVHAGDAA